MPASQREMAADTAVRRRPAFLTGRRADARDSADLSADPGSAQPDAPRQHLTRQHLTRQSRRAGGWPLIAACLVTAALAVSGAVLTLLARGDLADGDLASNLGAAQIFLAGLGVFHHHSVGLGPHETLGFAMGGIAVLILVLALVARPGGRAIAGAAVLVVQTDLLQSLLAGLGDDAAVWGGLHALDGLLAIAVACYLYGSALTERRGGRARVES